MLRVSVHWGRPEVTGRHSNLRDDPHRTCAPQRSEGWMVSDLLVMEPVGTFISTERALIPRWAISIRSESNEPNGLQSDMTDAYRFLSPIGAEGFPSQSIYQ